MVPPLDVLRREAGFSLEELEANRGGKLTPGQIERERPGVGGFVFFLILGFLLLGGGVGGAAVFYDSLRKPVDRVDMNGVYALAAGGALLGFGMLAFAFSVLRGARRSRAQYERGTCISWDINFAFTQQQLTFKDYFYVSRGNERLMIPRNLARVMTPGGNYRVYIVAGRLISLEPL